MISKNLNIPTLVSNDGCFDLQFRKDTRHKRTNSPTYYRWKTQFVVTVPKENKKVLEKIKKQLNCGKITNSGPQARFSVQKISDIFDTVIPYFKKNQLGGKKKNDFELWAKAVEIIKNNQGRALVNWKKSDLHSLIEIHKSCIKYKKRPRQPKWLSMARTFGKVS